MNPLDSAGPEGSMGQHPGPELNEKLAHNNSSDDLSGPRQEAFDLDLNQDRVKFMQQQQQLQFNNLDTLGDDSLPLGLGADAMTSMGFGDSSSFKGFVGSEDWLGSGLGF